jgi:hypothetical protein
MTIGNHAKVLIDFLRFSPECRNHNAIHRPLSQPSPTGKEHRAQGTELRVHVKRQGITV